MMTMERDESSESSVKKSVTVKCSVAHAFEIFTKRFDLWWPKQHHIGKADLKSAVVEEKVGGRWYEVGVDGSTCDWGKVLAFDPPKGLSLSWNISPMWTHDPDMNHASRIDVTFTDVGNGQTRVELVHSELEKHGSGWQEMQKQLASGWGGIVESFAQAAAKAAAS